MNPKFKMKSYRQYLWIIVGELIYHTRELNKEISKRKMRPERVRLILGLIENRLNESKTLLKKGEQE